MSDSWDSMDCSLPGSYVHGLFQARTLEWVAISFSRGSSTQGSISGHLHYKWSPALQANSLLTEPSGKPEKNKLNSHTQSCASQHAKSLQSCPALWDSMECSPPGSSVHGIPQARILEWVDMPSSRGSSWPRDQTCVSYISFTGRQVLYD